jgi:hypothetical protein
MIERIQSVAVMVSDEEKSKEWYIENTCKELKKKGVQFTRELGRSEWDEKMTYAMFKDPDDNVFWLMPN